VKRDRSVSKCVLPAIFVRSIEQSSVLPRLAEHTEVRASVERRWRKIMGEVQVGAREV